MESKLKRIVLERFVFFFLLFMLWFITGKWVRATDVVQGSPSGIIEKVYLSPRGKSSILLKFKNTDKLNQLSYIYNSEVQRNEELLMPGDSVSKKCLPRDSMYFERLKENIFSFII